jgi:tetratricopeptide (TPR) repeat protein
MSKPMTVTLPFVLLLLDYWPLGRFHFTKFATGSNPQQKVFSFGLVWEKIPFFVLAAASSVLTWVGQQKGGGVSSLDILPLHTRIGNALLSYVCYIGKTIWPHSLAVYYPYSQNLPLGQVVGAGLLLMCISLLVITAVRRRPYLALGWLWYLATLLPVIGFVQVGGYCMADRNTYIPLIGIFIIIAWGVPELLNRWRYRVIGLTSLAVAYIAILTAITWQQLPVWTNSITLFEHALDVTPPNSLSHYNLAHALDVRGRVDEAVRHYTEALRINPNHGEAHIAIGNLLEFQGKKDKAIRHYSEALRIDPGDAGAHNNLGNILAHQGRMAEAVRHYSEALRIKPGYAEANNNLGNALKRQGKMAEAIRHYSEALRINPYYANAHFNLGAALIRTKKIDEAIFHFREVLRIMPDDADAYQALKTALAAKGKID